MCVRPALSRALPTWRSSVSLSIRPSVDPTPASTSPFNHCPPLRIFFLLREAYHAKCNVVVEVIWAPRSDLFVSVRGVDLHLVLAFEEDLAGAAQGTDHILFKAKDFFIFLCCIIIATLAARKPISMEVAKCDMATNFTKFWCWWKIYLTTVTKLHYSFRC